MRMRKPWLSLRGRPWKGRERVKTTAGSIERRREGNGLQGRYCFLRVLLPPDERKNPDWSNVMNYPILRSDWSAICHSRASVFSVSFTQHVNSRNRFELSVDETLRSLEENGIKSVSFCNRINAEIRRAIALTALSLDAFEFKLHTFEAWQKGPYAPTTNGTTTTSKLL